MSNNRFKGIRYQKRIKLGKLLHLNLTKSGIGLSVGIRGLRYTIGPAGTFLTVGLPGSGLRYQKKVADRKGFQYSSLKKLNPGYEAEESVKAQAESETIPEPEKPSLFAPRWEKALYDGVEAYHNDDIEEAIRQLQIASDDEDVDLGAQILLAFLLSEQPSEEDRSAAITLLEQVISSDKPFPSPLLEKYMQGIEVDIAITPQVEVTLSLQDALASPLLLVELYEEEGEIEQAIDLLDQIDDAIAQGNADEHHPILLLSLAELYMMNENYQEIIERIPVPDVVENDVVLGMLFFYGRALQEQNLHTAAIKIFTKCLRRKKGYNQALLGACQLWRAMSYIKEGKKARGREELEKVLAIAPTKEIKRATLQALQLFWPEEFSLNVAQSQPQLTDS